VILRKSGGKKRKNCGSLLTARSGGDGLIELPAVGTYRGDMKFGADGAAGLLTVNSVGLESYVKGVVPNEMPSSWPSKALRAQAVAARSYALATDKGHDAFDHYADTRSQVYGGVASETSKTNSAVKDTRGMVVKHDGEVAITYFFSTSGGMTENVESVWPGSSPTPYLKAAPDPYDAASPHHDWKVTYTGDEMKSLLSGLYSGDLLGIEVVETGASGRILKAKVEGSTGSTTVDGPTLQSRLGLRSTWASFERIVPSDSASRSRSRLEDWPCGLPKASGKGCSGIPWTVSPLPSPAP
jgi:stage II sporulation protein D